MKKYLNIAAAVALLFGVSTAAIAQDNVSEEYYPHNFISLQGGAQVTLTHYDLMDLVTPQFGVSFGRYFNSKVGARLHFQGYDIKGGFQQERFPGLTADADYTFKAITGDLDLLMNMTNIFNPNRFSDKVDWVLLAGFGINYGWDFDEFNTMNNELATHPNPYLCGTKHSTFNSRLGTQMNFNLSDKLALGLEVDVNMKNDEFNLKRNYDPDWQLAAFLGLTYKFGHPKKAAPVVYEESIPEPKPEVKPEPKPEPKPEVKPEPKPKAAVVQEVPLKETFFYEIRLSDPDPEMTLNKIVTWCKKYPSKGITIKGYADKGTGNPKVNVGYAKARAEKVAKALQEKGIAADRMKVLSFGDTEQPFPDNDRNRCVIVVGE